MGCTVRYAFPTLFLSPPHCVSRSCCPYCTEPRLYSRCCCPSDSLWPQRGHSEGGSLRRLQPFRQGNTIHNEISRRACPQEQDRCSYVRTEDGPRIRTHRPEVHPRCRQAMGTHVRCSCRRQGRNHRRCFLDLSRSTRCVQHIEM